MIAFGLCVAGALVVVFLAGRSEGLERGRREGLDEVVEYLEARAARLDQLNQRVAAVCERVTLVAAGQPLRLKA